MTDQNQTPTPEEIEALKKNWMADPCWDIEDTEGFEAYKEDLLAFRKDQEKKWQEQWLAALEERREKVAAWTNINDIDMAQAIHTQQEIEVMINQGVEKENSLIIQAAHARATFLLATQIQRIAEAIEFIATEDSGGALINSSKIWGS